MMSKAMNGGLHSLDLETPHTPHVDIREAKGVTNIKECTQEHSFSPEGVKAILSGASSKFRGEVKGSTSNNL
jgi:hypothetical protein